MIHKMCCLCTQRAARCDGVTLLFVFQTCLLTGPNG